MDVSTLESLAEMVCGDDSSRFPFYRTGGELTRFFERAGVGRFQHDGSTRKWWTLEALKNCTDREIEQVICRLASPREYGGDKERTRKAITALNEMLEIEGMGVYIDGVEPKIKSVRPSFEVEPAEAPLRPLPAPDFFAIGLEPGLGGMLALRWQEAEVCITTGCYLASLVMMGSLLEGLLLGTLQRFPKQANQSRCCPIDNNTGKPKPFWQWSLSEMIEVAHAEKWLGLDVKRFLHSLRDFRNYIHPYEQMASGFQPDEDTCKICWLVVQAAANDLAKVLNGAT